MPLGIILILIWIAFGLIGGIINPIPKGAIVDNKLLNKKRFIYWAAMAYAGLVALVFSIKNRIIHNKKKQE